MLKAVAKCYWPQIFGWSLTAVSVWAIVAGEAGDGNEGGTPADALGVLGCFGVTLFGLVALITTFGLFVADDYWRVRWVASIPKELRAVPHGDMIRIVAQGDLGAPRLGVAHVGRRARHGDVLAEVPAANAEHAIEKMAELRAALLPSESGPTPEAQSLAHVLNRE